MQWRLALLSAVGTVGGLLPGTVGAGEGALTLVNGAPTFGNGLRAKWMFADNFTNMNHGAYGACPKPVMEAKWGYERQMEANMELWMNGSPLDSGNPPDSPKQHGYRGLVARSREVLAEYVNASAEDVVLIDNASNAINALLRSLPLKPGDILVDFSVVYVRPLPTPAGSCCVRSPPR